MIVINLNPFPLLVTERLTLREINLSDAEALFVIRSDERVMKYIDRPIAKSIEDASRLIQTMKDLEKNLEAVTWAITMKGDPKLIGNIGYWRMTKENFRAEIGYLLHPDYQRKGIMQEAMPAVLNYGFNVMKLHSVEANVNPENNASIKLLEKNKFVREAYFKENFYYNGKFLDTVLYSLLTSVT